MQSLQGQGDQAPRSTGRNTGRQGSGHSTRERKDSIHAWLAAGLRCTWWIKGSADRRTRGVGASQEGEGGVRERGAVGWGWRPRRRCPEGQRGDVPGRRGRRVLGKSGVGR